MFSLTDSFQLRIMILERNIWRLKNRETHTTKSWVNLNKNNWQRIYWGIMSPQESKIFKRETNCTFMLLAHLDIQFMCDIVITWQFTSVNVFICHLHSLTQDDGIAEQGFNIELCMIMIMCVHKSKMVATVDQSFSKRPCVIMNKEWITEARNLI